MTTTIKSIFTDVVGVTTDDTLVRWPLSLMALYYNDFMNFLVNIRPDASIVDEDFTCAAGYVQSMAAGTTQLIQPKYNVTHSSKRAVTMISVDRLDASLPGWRGYANKTYVYHVMYDVRNPLSFLNYPPVASGTKIRIVRGVYPAAMAIPAAAAELDDLTGDCPLQDKYVNALREYMLHRCYDLDADGQSNPQRSGVHLARVGMELGIEIKAKVLAGPRTSAGNPNVSATKPASDGAV